MSKGRYARSSSVEADPLKSGKNKLFSIVIILIISAIIMLFTIAEAKSPNSKFNPTEPTCHHIKPLEGISSFAVLPDESLPRISINMTAAMNGNSPSVIKEIKDLLYKAAEPRLPNGRNFSHIILFTGESPVATYYFRMDKNDGKTVYYFVTCDATLSEHLYDYYKGNTQVLPTAKIALYPNGQIYFTSGK